ncbi:hypothetical protein DIPPA_05185 [Diplonema papillatum]|nr:hypothetical protein DIPPA_05185 [Diplonema papillatum]
MCKMSPLVLIAVSPSSSNSAAGTSPKASKRISRRDVSNKTGAKTPEGFFMAFVSLAALAAGYFFPHSFDFNSWWCAVTAVGFLLPMPALTRFYTYFTTSGLWLADRRGFGSRGHAPYGLEFLRPPKLTAGQFQATGYALVGLLLLGAAHPTSRVVMSGAYVSAYLLLTQLFAETTTGQHSSLVVPNVLAYLVLSPQLAPTLVQWHMVTLYFGGGLCKIGGSLISGKMWCCGESLRSGLFHALWSRPGPTPDHWITRLQAKATCLPGVVLCVLSCGALVFELGSPVAVVLGHKMLFALAAWSFHVGVFVMYGIDFVSHWTPALLAFCAASMPCGCDGFEGVWEVGEWLAVGYLGLQVWFGVVTLNEARGGPGPLPFSCSPMFAMPQDLCGDGMVNWFTDIDCDLRAAGHLGTVEWSGPPIASHFLGEDDMKRLPYRVSYMGSTYCRFPRVSNWIQPEYRLPVDGSHLFFTNRPASDVIVAQQQRFSANSPLCGPRHCIPASVRAHMIEQAVRDRLDILHLRNRYNSQTSYRHNPSTEPMS